ncbi:hypothetical protein TNCV_4294071 [Trichonephila clavipes]|uniref:Uncharacterized protein n=1 Tax=Trichonephila clavipes TaxID=2585209 RepID=A0A8X6RSK7_TRICX|nr:hypothetical protein TNCV_4294071 [Trichonephila clavipes]
MDFFWVPLKYEEWGMTLFPSYEDLIARISIVAGRVRDLPGNFQNLWVRLNSTKLQLYEILCNMYPRYSSSHGYMLMAAGSLVRVLMTLKTRSHGSLVVKSCHAPKGVHPSVRETLEKPSTAEDPPCRGRRCTSRLKCPPVGVVWKLAQLSFS